MAKITNPVRFSTHFGIDPAALDRVGVLDPTLNADTRLFIDPFLIPSSAHKEMSIDGRATYEKHFRQIIGLLAGSKQANDAPWRSAKRLLQFPEVKWTCLGYGGQSVSGSGSGPFTTDGLIQTAKEIVDLGITDPDLFVAMGVFEEGIGPDRISDMATNVILPDLLKFNRRVLSILGLPVQAATLTLKNGATHQADLPMNPYEKGGAPIILVPADILRDLPIVTDWSDVSDAASKNAVLRNQVNRQIADIWKRKTLKDKARLRQWATGSKQGFETFLSLLKSSSPQPYDITGDPLGELVWRRVAETIATDEPFALSSPAKATGADVAEVVLKIIEQFQFLIEKRRHSEDLYHKGKPRPEKAAQRLFFAVASSYCKANNIDLTPEADTGNGPVDFKMSSGFSGRVLVEVKLSTNPKVLAGYEKQLQAYKDAEQTTHGFYVVIDVGGMGKKDQRLLARKNALAEEGKLTSEIVLIDATRRPSASKLV